MEKDKYIFNLIVTNAVYAFLKEKYPDYNIEEKSDSKNIKKFTSYLSEIESYAHIPDKKLIIEAEYQTIKQYMIKSEFREEKLLESVKEKSQNLTIEEKEDILNSVIYVMHMDNKISKTEKPITLQVAKFLGIDKSYEDIIGEYKKSGFKEPMSTLLIISISVLLLGLIVGGIFWKYKQQDENNIKIFKTNKTIFNEVYFNKFVIYKNKFNIEDEHFKKQAVFHISGSAEISFNPEKVEYNSINKSVTLIYPKNKFFDIDVHFSQALEVDKIAPEPIAAEKAKKIAAIVGIAGAYGGAKIGSKGGDLLALVLPPNIKLFAKPIIGGVGGIAGGAGAYYVTSKALTNLPLSKAITAKEKVKVIATGEELIKAQLVISEELIKLYKENFEQYIKLQYKRYGKDINSINYKEEK